MKRTEAETEMANAVITDLYEALKTVLARMESLYDTVLGYEDAIGEEDVYLTQEARDQAEGAMSKAEGIRVNE